MTRLVFLGRLADVAGAGERPVAAGPLGVVLAGLPVGLAAALMEPRVRLCLLYTSRCV